MPPVLIGGHSEASMRRAVRHGAAWMPSVMSVDEVAAASSRLGEIAEELGGPKPEVQFGIHALIDGSAEQRDELLSTFTSGLGMSAERAAAVTLVGTPAQVAERMAAYLDAGADSLGFALHGDPVRQVELAAAARELL